MAVTVDAASATSPGQPSRSQVNTASAHPASSAGCRSANHSTRQTSRTSCTTQITT